MHKAKVAEYKKNEVNEVSGLIKKYNVIGIIDVTGLPSMQLQKLRHSLRNTMLVRLTKKSLIKLAIENVKNDKKEIEKLEGYLNNIIPALLFTREDPFKLAKTLAKNKSNAFAKTGQIAPRDIIIEPGITNFPPGPIIGELGQHGIKTAVEAGKIAIKESKLVAKKGEVINAKVADLLSKLGIQPMEIGLNLVVMYKDGEIYLGEILNIDETEYLNNLVLAHGEAISLALNIGYITKDTINYLIVKGNTEANALANKIDYQSLNIRNSDDEKHKDKELEGVARDILNKLADEKIEKEEKRREEEEKKNKIIGL